LVILSFDSLTSSEKEMQFQTFERHSSKIF
jgi:hypothetical protein